MRTSLILAGIVRCNHRPLTVPLVRTMGLGIGSKTGAIDGFGVLAGFDRTHNAVL